MDLAVALLQFLKVGKTENYEKTVLRIFGCMYQNYGGSKTLSKLPGLLKINEK